MQQVQEPSRSSIVMPACSSQGLPSLIATYRGYPEISQLARRKSTSPQQARAAQTAFVQPSSHRIISQRILLITERIAAGLGLYVLGTAPQLRHVRPSWASHHLLWTSAAHSCRLWRPTCAAAGHQEWTAEAWAALCPSPRLRPPPLRAAFQREQQTPQHRWKLSLPTAVSHIPLPTQSQPWRSTRRHHIPSLPWTVMNPLPCQRTPLPGTVLVSSAWSALQSHQAYLLLVRLSHRL
jgi:hypothetical protein